MPNRAEVEVVFACVRNAGRSQMAAALAERELDRHPAPESPAVEFALGEGGRHLTPTGIVDAGKHNLDFGLIRHGRSTAHPHKTTPRSGT